MGNPFNVRCCDCGSKVSIGAGFWEDMIIKFPIICNKCNKSWDCTADNLFDRQPNSFWSPEEKRIVAKREE